MPRRIRHRRTDPACSRFVGWGAYGLVPRFLERRLRGRACLACCPPRRPALIPTPGWPNR